MLRRGPWLFWAAPTLFLAPALFFGRSLFLRDTGLYFYPHKAMVREALLHGRLPQWTAAEYAGMPLLADPNFNVFHPLTWLTLPVPWPFGYHLQLLFCSAIAAYGARALARELEVGPEGAVVAGLCWAFCGPFVSLLVTGQVVVLAFMPWLCAAGVRLSRDPSLRSVGLAAVAAALVLLSGTPEVGACAFLLGLLLAGRRAPLFLAASALGALAAAVQLAPTAAFMPESTRGGGFEALHAFSGALQLVRLPNLLVPFFAGAEDAAGTTFWAFDPDKHTVWVEEPYLGAIPLLLALYAPASRKRRLFFLAGAAFLLFAIDTPLGAAAWSLLRGRVRYPEKLVFPFALGVAVLAGAGWERARAHRGSALWALKRAGLCAALALAATVAVRFVRFADDRRAASFEDTAARTVPLELAIAGLGFALLWLSAREKVRWPALAGLALLAFDLGGPAARLDWTIPTAELEAPSEVAAALVRDLPDARLFRVDVQATGLAAADLDGDGPRPRRLYLLRHQALYHPGAAQGPLLLMRGYSGFPAEPAKALLAAGKLDELSVRYGVELGRPRRSVYGALGFRPFAAFADGLIRVWKNDRALPRLRATGEARLIEDAPERIEAEARLPADGTVTLADTLVHGWSATLDGEPAAFEPGPLRIVRVPAGTHRLVFRYRAPGLVRGALVSLLGCAGIGVLLIRRRRRTE